MRVICQGLDRPCHRSAFAGAIGSHAVWCHTSLHSTQTAAAGKAAEARKGPGRLPRFGVVSGASYVLQEVRSSDGKAYCFVRSGNKL